MLTSKRGLATAPEEPHTNGASQMTGNPNEGIPMGRTALHPRSYQAERLVEAAADDNRDMYMDPKRTDQFKG